MKTIAMYLPQFHNIPENDEWWGDGFTEWMAVKRAKPLFAGHQQPRIPLNRNYYNLLEKKTMEWQAELAKQYKVYGFCFYHYWFANGRKILEKPAENLLKWKDIELPYCFCWANQTWARTWSNIGDKNAWAMLYEKKGEEKSEDAGILLEQKYGREQEWQEHFAYLLPFFRDSRYIHIQGKPVFIFYKPEQIACLDEMITEWQMLAKENGLLGIYTIVLDVSAKRWENVDASLILEPGITHREMLSEKNRHAQYMVNGFSYDQMWKRTLGRTAWKGEKCFFGGFVGYDNTPRQGKAGLYDYGESPTKFQNYFRELVQKNANAGNDYVFINAWNEWGEGMYLEPDETNKYKYLEAVKTVMEEAIKKEDVEKERSVQEAINSKQIDIEQSIQRQYSKINNYYNILNNWMYLRDQKRNLKDFFYSNGYRRIAIYGMGHLGKHLWMELKESDIQIVYAIDKRENCWNLNLPVVSIAENLEEVDAIVVTPVMEFKEIRTTLREKVHCPVISIEEIIGEV